MSKKIGRRIDNGRYGKSYSNILTKEFLEQKYSKELLSTYKIAEIVGCTPRTVYDYIDFYKIQRIKMNGEIKPNQNFGILTTIKVVGKTKNGTYNWLCKCECGNETTVPTSRLKNGRVKSCGCYKRRKKSANPQWKGYCDVSGNRISDIRYRARAKKMDFNLDAKFLWELLVKQNKRCALTNLPIEVDINASVDRIDSSGGYTKDNVQWVHRDINKMKSDLKTKDFIMYCKLIYLNGKEK